jgi:GNAT superfamily N-acetyltransferase
MRIRLATSGDCRALAHLRYRFRTETESATETKSQFARRCASWMKKRIRSDSYPWRCWVLDDGKQLLGHVCVQVFEKVPNPLNDEPELHAYVTNFYVVPEMRSQGLGKGLLNKALSWCRARGTDAIILWATPGSRSLYRRCGLAEAADIFELRYPSKPYLRSAFVKRTSSSATSLIRCVIFLSLMCSPLKTLDVAKANRGIMTQRKSSMRLLA